MRHVRYALLRPTVFLCAVACAAMAPRGDARAATFGEVLESNATITFSVNRSNVPGRDFDLILPGLCLYDDGFIEGNTFSIGGDDFPDLLLSGRRIQAAFEVTASSFHVGTLTIDCQGARNRSSRKIRSFRCSVEFFSPARPEIQLDHCSAGAEFGSVRRFRGR